MLLDMTWFLKKPTVEISLFAVEILPKKEKFQQ